MYSQPFRASAAVLEELLAWDANDLPVAEAPPIDNPDVVKPKKASGSGGA